MTIDSTSLGRFLPQFLRERYALGAKFDQRYAEWPISGALLFVDVVGFTGRVERLVSEGPQGVELASELIELSIGRLIETFGAEGGDLVVFGGDGLFVLWTSIPGDSSLVGAINRAASSALNALKTYSTDLQGKAPQLRFSLGAGQFLAHRVGGHQGKWHCLLSGPAFEQVQRADALAQNNALITTEEVWALADGRITVSPMALGLVQVRSCKPIDTRSAPFFAQQQDCPSALALPHVCEPILHNLARLDSHWLAEFRRPSVIFARLPNLISHGRLEGRRAHDATRIIQGIVSEHGGSILQFVVDDKGPVLVIAFGLSARVHEDDAARAASCALAMLSALVKLGIECCTGIATGRVFCSLIGNRHRSHYTLIGHTMNFAARLMQNASPGPLCDQLTQDLSRNRIDYVLKGLIDVKGMESASTHFQATGKPTLLPDHRNFPDARTPLFGRDPEIEILRSQLNALVSQRRGGLIALIGEAGIGKTRLIREISAQARSLSVLSLIAEARAGDGAPQAHWGSVIRSLLELETADKTENQTLLDPYLQAFLGQAPQHLPDTDDAERALRTRESIAQLIRAAAARAPLMLCIEDTHWMDSLSWSLLARLTQDASKPASGLLLIMSTREMETNAPPDVLKRISALGMQKLTLGPLPEKDRALVAQLAIGACSLSERADNWIVHNSGGNPLFCRELAADALDSGRLQLIDGHADWIDGADGDGAYLHMPDTLSGVIASRLDRLNQKQQIALRVAAVIGARFALPALMAMNPEPEEDLRDQMDSLCTLGFLHRIDSDQPAIQYSFHHALIRDAAYDSLPYRRRRELHAGYAQWLEAQSQEAAPVDAAELARHWEQAEHWLQAFEKRLEAGRTALADFANREAAKHFSNARTLRGRSPALSDHPLAWEAELGLAQALHRMGDERASRRHIEEALRAFGERIPSSGAGKAWALSKELAARTLGLRGRAPRHLRKDVPRLRMTVKAYDLLPDILYYDNDPLALAYTTLRFERLATAEKRPSAEQARALAWLGLLYSAAGKAKQSEQSLADGIAVAQRARDVTVEAWIRLAQGSLLAQLGVWSDSERWLRDALSRCESQGDRSRAWNVMSALGHVLAYQGQLAEGRGVLQKALVRNADTDNPLFLAWGSAGLAGLMHRQGLRADRPKVLQLLARARESLQSRPDAAAELFSRGLHAAAMCRDGQREESIDLVRETIEVALERAPLVWLQVSSYLCMEEVLCAAAEDRSQQASVLRMLQKIRKSLRVFSRIIPIGRPSLALVRARIWIIRGKPEEARKQLRIGLNYAMQLGLAYEIGRIHLALAEISMGSQTNRELDLASTIFSRIGAHWDQELIQQRRLALAGIEDTLT